MIGSKFHSRYLNINQYLPPNISIWIEPFGGSFGLARLFSNNWKESIYCEIDSITYEKWKQYGTKSYHQDWKKTLSDFDNKDCFFFIDPPYYGKEKYYDQHFTEHDELFNRLKDLKSNFLLTYNDCSYIRNLYKDFKIITYHSDIYHKEILIINY
jgi:hypothetical protein